MVGRLQTTAIDKKRTTHSFLENIFHSISAWLFMELFTLEEQFKLKYGRFVGRSASVSTLPLMETCKADIPTKESRKEREVKLPYAQSLGQF